MKLRIIDRIRLRIQRFLRIPVLDANDKALLRGLGLLDKAIKDVEKKRGSDFTYLVTRLGVLEKKKDKK